MHFPGAAENSLGRLISGVKCSQKAIMECEMASINMIGYHLRHRYGHPAPGTRNPAGISHVSQEFDRNFQSKSLRYLLSLTTAGSSTNKSALVWA